jgi:hypothetical protein
MKLNELFFQFQQSSWLTKLAFSLLGLVWIVVLAGLLGLGILLIDSPSRALQPTPGGISPAIYLDPATGSAGSTVTVRGEGWTDGSMVLLYLSTTGETPDYALASAIVDGEGRFTVNLVIPQDTPWTVAGNATLVARTQDESMSAQATLNIASPGDLSGLTPTATLSPTATAEVSPTPTATPQPGAPLATTVADLNIRGGPGTNYPVLGLLKAGQTAEITGRSADGGWWQIKFSGVASERGWLSAKYVTAQNTDSVPVVQAPPLPTASAPTPTPVPSTPTPVIITDWRG